MTALIKINALPVKPIDPEFSVSISEQTAQSLAGAHTLPKTGESYAVLWGSKEGQITGRLMLVNLGGAYHLRSHAFKVENWERVFNISIEEV